MHKLWREWSNPCLLHSGMRVGTQSGVTVLHVRPHAGRQDACHGRPRLGDLSSRKASVLMTCQLPLIITYYTRIASHLTLLHPNQLEVTDAFQWPVISLLSEEGYWQKRWLCLQIQFTICSSSHYIYMQEYFTLLLSSRLGGVVVSVLATRPGSGSKPSQGDGFLRAIKVRSTTYFGWEIKPEIPCRKIWRNVKDPLAREMSRMTVPSERSGRRVRS
jgi:hypothetical protein